MKHTHIGLVGLGVMGENLALNLERNGFSVTGFDLDANKCTSFAKRTEGLQACAANSLAELVANLQLPRRVWLMVPAGAPVDAVLNELRTLLSAGDVVIDGGNTLYRDTQRRIDSLEGTGILFVGAGVSGGEEGALHGPALMPGGSPEAWPLVRPFLQARLRLQHPIIPIELMACLRRRSPIRVAPPLPQCWIRPRRTSCSLWPMARAVTSLPRPWKSTMPMSPNGGVSNAAGPRAAVSPFPLAKAAKAILRVSRPSPEGLSQGV